MTVARAAPPEPEKSPAPTPGPKFPTQGNKFEAELRDKLRHEMETRLREDIPKEVRIYSSIWNHVFEAFPLNDLSAFEADEIRKDITTTIYIQLRRGR